MSGTFENQLNEQEERRKADVDRRQSAIILAFPDQDGDRRKTERRGTNTEEGVNMADAQIIENPAISAEAATGRGQLVAVEGIDAGTCSSRALFDGYIEQREGVKELAKIEGTELLGVQASVRSWLDQNPSFTEGQNYDDYDIDRVKHKLHGLTDYLRLYHPGQVSELELTATEAFVASAFAMYEDREDGGATSPDADGSFAFVVPARMSRKNRDYGQEVEPVIPALRYVPNELRAQMMVGLPPFIIDTYKPDDTGKRGYLVLAPIFTDLKDEIDQAGGGMMDFMKASRPHVDAAVDFVQQRLGVSVVGLGAVIPSLTNYGKAVNNEKVLVTSGHGGTAYLVKETARKAIREGLVANSEHPRVGVLGLGAIGGPIANLAAAEFDPPTRIFDTDESKRNRTERNIEAAGGVAIQMENEEDLVDHSDVILSAIVGRVPLSRFKNRPNLKGKVVIDDSQPGSFDPEEVQAHGGTELWVIAQDTNGIVRREGYDYGTMHDGEKDLFGCEAEAGVLYQYAQELQKRGTSDKVMARILSKVAVKEAVTPQKARLIGALFKKYGIVPSEFQAFGKLVQPVEA